MCNHKPTIIQNDKTLTQLMDKKITNGQPYFILLI